MNRLSFNWLFALSTIWLGLNLGLIPSLPASYAGDAKAAYSHAELALSLYKKGSLTGAANEFRQASLLDPTNASYHKNLSSILLCLGKNQEALKEAKAAAKLNPGKETYLINLANVYVQMKDYALAEQAYRSAFRLNNSDKACLKNLSLCLRQLNKKKEAAEVLTKYLAKHPHDGEILTDLANLQLEDKDYKQAEKTARQAVKATPNNADAHLALAHVLKDTHKDTEALIEFKTVLKLDPKHQSTDSIKKVIDFLERRPDSRI